MPTNLCSCCEVYYESVHDCIDYGQRHKMLYLKQSKCCKHCHMLQISHKSDIHDALKLRTPFCSTVLHMLLFDRCGLF